MNVTAIHHQLTGLVAYAGRLGRAVFDPPGRFPFHQVGHPRLPRYLWPLEQVFQPPRFAFGIASLGLDNNCFTNFALSTTPAETRSGGKANCKIPSGARAIRMNEDQGSFRLYEAQGIYNALTTQPRANAKLCLP
jgi:hypothetical protein